MTSSHLYAHGGSLGPQAQRTLSRGQAQSVEDAGVREIRRSQQGLVVIKSRGRVGGIQQHSIGT